MFSVHYRVYHHGWSLTLTVSCGEHHLGKSSQAHHRRCFCCTYLHCAFIFRQYRIVFHVFSFHYLVGRWLIFFATAPHARPYWQAHVSAHYYYSVVGVIRCCPNCVCLYRTLFAFFSRTAVRPPYWRVFVLDSFSVSLVFLSFIIYLVLFFFPSSDLCTLFGFLVGMRCSSCCWSHNNSHSRVRGHRTGSSHSGVEEYPTEKCISFLVADASRTCAQE